MDEADERSRLAITVGGFVSAMLSPILPSELLTTGAVLTREVLGEIVNRGHRKRIENLHKLFAELDRRIPRERAAPEKVDLFEEILKRAIDDDDSEKIECYAKLVELVMSRHPPLERWHIRATAEALKALMPHEISALHYLDANRPSEFGLGEFSSSFLPRLVGLGICKDSTTKTSSNITPLGRQLLSVSKNLAPEWVQRARP